MSNLNSNYYNTQRIIDAIDRLADRLVEAVEKAAEPQVYNIVNNPPSASAAETLERIYDSVSTGAADINASSPARTLKVGDTLEATEDYESAPVGTTVEDGLTRTADGWWSDWLSEPLDEVSA